MSPIALGGCAGSGSERTTGAEEQARVAQAVSATFEAYAVKDLDRYLDGWSDEGFERTFGVAMQEAHHVPPSLGGVRSFRESELVLRGVSNVRILDQRAIVEAQLVEDHVVRTLRLQLIRGNDRWLLDSAREISSTPPRGAQRVRVALSEYRIGLRPELPRRRNLALDVKNAGREVHELLLLRLRPDADQSVEWIRALKPAASRQLVLTQLPPGRYALVCNRLGPDNSPHSSKGMRTVFTIW